MYTQQLTDFLGAHESSKSLLGDIFGILLSYFFLQPYIFFA